MRPRFSRAVQLFEGIAQNELRHHSIGWSVNCALRLGRAVHPYTCELRGLGMPASSKTAKKVSWRPFWPVVNLKEHSPDFDARRLGSDGDVYRRLFFGGKKGGRAVGPTGRGKGSKIMAIADRHGLPVAVGIASASPHEASWSKPPSSSRSPEPGRSA